MKKILLAGFVAISAWTAFAQTSSKKESRELFKQVVQLDTNEIKSGKHLELAKELTVEEFVSYYLENGQPESSKMYKELRVEELYQDSIYAYLARKHNYGLIEFIKVKSPDFNGLELNKLNGNAIRKKLIDEIVPQSDKDRVAKKMKRYQSFSYNPSFTYDYQQEKKEVIITYHWKITSTFIRIVNKKYSARYDIASETFTENLTPTE